MSRELLALRAALTEAHPDAIYMAYLGIRQAAHREPDPATKRLMLAVTAVLEKAYEGEAVTA